MNKWSQWKERNADWFQPLIAWPLVFIISISWAIIYAVFWLPSLIVKLIKAK